MGRLFYEVLALCRRILHEQARAAARKGRPNAVKGRACSRRVRDCVGVGRAGDLRREVLARASAGISKILVEDVNLAHGLIDALCGDNVAAVGRVARAEREARGTRALRGAEGGERDGRDGHDAAGAAQPHHNVLGGALHAGAQRRGDAARGGAGAGGARQRDGEHLASEVARVAAKGRVVRVHVALALAEARSLHGERAAARLAGAVREGRARAAGRAVGREEDLADRRAGLEAGDVRERVRHRRRAAAGAHGAEGLAVAVADAAAAAGSAAGLLSVMFFSGESADSYPEIVAGRFRDLFDVRIGSPRGHFDFAGYNSYTVSPEILSNSTSPQLATLRAAGGWPTDRPLVAMAVSHCAVGTTRGDYFRDLMAVMRVDSFGSCLNNAKVTAEVVAAAVAAPKLLCTGCDWPYRKEKLALLRNYPFALAFENSNCYDSVTEKIYDVLLAGAVPVYLGAPNVEEWAPAGSYIDARLFSGPEELAEYLTVLASDPERYAQYHAWRLQPAGGDAFRLMRMTLAGVNNQCIVFKLGSIPCGVGQ